ncbi:hypothetical protein KC335_g10176, partial [Hortaea werneckii]
MDKVCGQTPRRYVVAAALAGGIIGKWSETLYSGKMSAANQYIRQVLHHPEAPPPIEARFFYTSPLPIDDPLSPVPPPTGAKAPLNQPPKPFSDYDNRALDKAWHDLRRKILKYNEEQSEKSVSREGSRSRAGSGATPSRP